MANIVNLKNIKKDTIDNTSDYTFSVKKNQIEWTAPEFEKKEKNQLWILILGLIVLIVIIYSIFTKNYSFAIVLLLACACLYIYDKKEPKEFNFSLSHRGISIENKNYPYNELKSFWIFYEPPRLKQLTLISKKTFNPRIQIPLDNQDPNKIRSLLLKYLPEIEEEESLIDVLADKLGF